MTTGPPGKTADDELTPAEAAWPFNPDSPHVSDIVADGGRVRTLLVDVTGLDWDEIEVRLDTVIESARRSRLVPVFLTDTLDVLPFYQRELVFDAIPRAVTQVHLLPEPDWTGYIERRRRQIVEKWRPAATVRLGSEPGEAP